MESIERGMSCSVCMAFSIGFLGYKTHGEVNGNMGKSKSKGECLCLKWTLREWHGSDVMQIGLVIVGMNDCSFWYLCIRVFVVVLS